MNLALTLDAPSIFGAPVWSAAIFAHQGGWDEFLLVALPLVLIGLLLWVANRRVSAQLAATAAEAAADPDRPGGDRLEPGPDTADRTNPASDGEPGPVA